jgi:hypothetical protein
MEIVAVHWLPAGVPQPQGEHMRPSSKPSWKIYRSLNGAMHSNTLCPSVRQMQFFHSGGFALGAHHSVPLHVESFSTWQASAMVSHLGLGNALGTGISPDVHSSVAIVSASIVSDVTHGLTSQFWPG